MFYLKVLHKEKYLTKKPLKFHSESFPADGHVPYTTVYLYYYYVTLQRDYFSHILGILGVFKLVRDKSSLLK